VDIPDLVQYPKARSDEYDKYTPEQISRVVKQWLFIGDTSHRELDREILGLDSGKSKGYESMNILHYLGLSPVFKGVFRDCALDNVIDGLRRNCQDFTEIIDHLEWEERNLDFKVCHKLTLIGNARDRNFGRRLKEYLERDSDIGGSDNVDLYRKEQAILKVLIFDTLTELQCSICLTRFPTDLMTLAYIKPRSQCSELERLDLSIVMPVCQFGCGSLYKHNYLVVDDRGRISAVDYKLVPDSLLLTLKSLEGNKCSWFSDGTRKYFSYTRQLLEHTGQLRFV